MALVGSHSQGGRSVNLRHGGESFRERGQGQWTDRDGSREYGNGEASVSAAAPVWVRWTPHPAPRLPPIPPITHGSVKPDGLTISLTAKDVAVGGIRENWRTREGRLAIMKVAVLLISIMKSLIQKISSLAILNQQTSRLMGLLRYR